MSEDRKEVHKGASDASNVNTAVQRAEALLKTGALQRAILNSANFSSIATDAEGVIQIFNVGAERMLGYSAAEVINKITPADISDPQEVIARATALSLELGTPIAPGFEALVFKASRGIEDIYELTYFRKDGSRFPAVVSVTALRDVESAIIGYLLIGTDNTERQKIEEERKLLARALEAKNAELESASRMKSEFLANMSHELRTPLNAIIGFSEVLKDGMMGDLTDEQRGFVSEIFESGKHLLSLINDILDLSKVEAGAMLLNLEPVRISSLLENSLSIVREKASNRNILLELDAPEELSLIFADVRKFKQIVYNLLSNAVKFATDGTRVTVHASRVPRAEVGQPCSSCNSWLCRSFPLAGNEFNEFLRLSVTDRGLGISPEGLEQLFTPFTQIDGGPSRKFEGTGLGLTMVKLLAELHGGTVALESAVSEGTCCTIWLPLRAPDKEAMARYIDDEAEQKLSTASTKPAEFSRFCADALGKLQIARTAMVVEDDLRSAELMRVQLEAEGFTVLHAVSAEAALILAMQQPLSLITLDIMLPNMDGWEFLRCIKNIPALSRIPVVIMSIVADQQKGFSLGAAAIMQKPISRSELHEALSDLGLLSGLDAPRLKVLIVDDDPKAVELIAIRIVGLVGTILRAYGGLEAIDTARKELPDVIMLDLMMPEVSGFDVVEALQHNSDTARIPIIIVTAKQITAEDLAALHGSVMTIVEKTEFDRERFIIEVRRAMALRNNSVHITD